MICNAFKRTVSDEKSFTLIYSEFIAYSGPNVGAAAHNRRNCVINIKMAYPQGWSYAINTVDFRGFVNIPSGIAAIQKTNIYTSGETDDSSATFRLIGPTIKDYVVRTTIATDALVWSPCGAEVTTNINAQVRLEGDLTRSGQITVDSTDGKVRQIYGLQWKRC